MQLIRIKYRCKCILGIKGLPAWGIVLPLLLATLFYFSVGNISSKIGAEPISIGIVSDFEIDGTDIFPKERFEVMELTQALADRYLEEGIIIAYLKMTGSKTELVALKSDKEQMECLAYADAYRNHIDHTKTQVLFADKTASVNRVMTERIEYRRQIVIITCLSMLLPAVIILSEVTKNRRSVMMRHYAAAISKSRLIMCDTIIVVTLIVLMAAMVYIYTLYLVSPIVL